MAKQIYLTYTGLGAQNGTDPADAYSFTFFGNSLNWGPSSNQISPGDTVTFMGIATGGVYIPSGGSLGNPVTLLFAPNAKISTPASNTIQIAANQNYLIIDGGTNGILENTANGSSLANQNDTSAVITASIANFELRNMTMQNFFVNVPADNFFLNFVGGGLYSNGFGNSVSIHNCNFTNMHWCVNMNAGSFTGTSGLSVYNNYFSGYDHGLAGLGGTYTNIYNNIFADTANWDTSGNYYHHDGIHFFWGSGGSMSGINIYNNVFKGDWGAHNTAHIFMEGDFSHNNPNSIINVATYNNLFLQYSGNYLNNGFLAGGGVIENNTFVGSYPTGFYNSVAISAGGTGTVIRNNIVANVCSFVALPATGAIVNNNIYYNESAGGNGPFILTGLSANSFAQWQTWTQQDSNSQYITGTNVNLMNQINGLLVAGSPAIGSGANLSSSFNTDYAGNPRPATGPWDIGAYQFLVYRLKRLGPHLGACVYTTN